MDMRSGKKQPNQWVTPTPHPFTRPLLKPLQIIVHLRDELSGSFCAGRLTFVSVWALCFQFSLIYMLRRFWLEEYLNDVLLTSRSKREALNLIENKNAFRSNFKRIIYEIWRVSSSPLALRIFELSL